jgi:hypothetical protein
MRARGVPQVLYWSEDPVAVIAAQFASTFFTALSIPGTTVIEAYTLSLYSTQAHCGAKVEGSLVVPAMPDLLSGPEGHEEGPELQLPDNTSVPALQLTGVDVSQGLAAAVPGEWCRMQQKGCGCRQVVCTAEEGPACGCCSRQPTCSGCGSQG